jgi:hypothetical protein
MLTNKILPNRIDYKNLGKKKLQWIQYYSLIRNLLMEKKGKATKCMFLPKISRLGIGEDSLCIYNPTVYNPHFQLQRKLGGRFLKFYFWSVILNQMPIPESKKCPNPIIISSNMGIGNLVKETIQSAPYINPPFAFPAPKEKRKYISASARTNLFIYLFFPCPRGHVSASAWTEKKIKKILYVSVWVHPCGRVLHPPDGPCAC